ncbi:unnamed protein product [Caenorhabditis angaria]|uniref:Receptor-mediated endocytosis protein 6 n=1 Tax=Caenorhabditis angaria TaxID=860376 RepID=A0A9P1J2P0_9PELO|nr:unnamed protein product [Caenorhabditis angaria]
MADIILTKIRQKDEYKEFYDIATKIRNHKLLTDAENESLVKHTKEVADAEIKLLTEAWQSSYFWIVLRQLKNQNDPLDPTQACRLLKIIKETVPQPAYKVIGRHFSTIDQLLCILYNEPSTVAAILNNIDQNDATFNDIAVQIIFHMVYSCSLYPEDELRCSQIICELLKVQLLKSNMNMRMMLRKETSISTRFYRLFVESSHSTMVYLTSALRKGVLSVVQLGNFWLDIDEKQSSTRFLRDNHQDKTRLPEYRALVVSKLVELVDIFLEEIHKSLTILPPSLNWIIRDIFSSLYEVLDDISAIELSHACKDMVISNLICPAIITPQKFGIIDNDVRIGAIVNHNLTQVAMIVQMISLREFEKPPVEYEEFLKQCRNTHLIPEMMDVLLMENSAPEVEVFTTISSGNAKSDLMAKSNFVGSVGDVNILMKLIREPINERDPVLGRVVKLCKRLPESFSSIPNNASEVENSPRLSTLKNIHKRVNQSLSMKRQDSSNDVSQPSDSIYFEKENFDIFFLEYLPENYEECRIEYQAPPRIEEVAITPEPEQVAETEPEVEPEIAVEVEAQREEEESQEQNIVEEQQHVPVDLLTYEIPRLEVNEPKRPESISPDPSDDQSAENRGGFAKLKSLGDRMKRGITQSNTLSDIRGHLRRSTSVIKSEIPTSSSDNALTKVSPEPPAKGPRDDILAKYAGKSTPKKMESLIGNLIDFISPNNQEVDEPYYSPDNLTSCRAFQDTLRKLATVLGDVSYHLHMNYRIKSEESGNRQKLLLDKFLGAILVEAEHRRENGLAAQIREVKRCIELFDNNGVITLLDFLKQEEMHRENAIVKLREDRIVLMRKNNDIASLEQRISLNRKLTEQNLVDSLMRTFIESGFLPNRQPNTRTPEVAAVLKFYDEFKYLLAQDERAEFLRNLLKFLKDRLMQNSDWNYATEAMITRAMTTIERFVMFAVYETAFYPNLGADQHRDKVLRASIAKVSQVVTADHDSLKIPKRLHGEAPWPSAQAELSMLDVYVTAQDKLKCVVRCCDVINNLIALSSKGAVASADDLTPVLVFVIIKANPRSLLSNVQFVETFAGDKIETGRDAYYWTNFKSAVEFIKTIL